MLSGNITTLVDQQALLVNKRPKSSIYNTIQIKNPNMSTIIKTRKGLNKRKDVAQPRMSTNPAGSDLIWKSLIKEGVTTVFGYPGGAVIPLYDALTRYPQIKHILVRNEQGAALAADGYARASGRAGVCIATSGPGGTNLVTGIANAYMDSIPLIAITGQVPRPVIGTDAFQEVDITGITMPITKHNYLVENVKDIPYIIKEAFHIAQTGRPGPVHIDITKDITSQQVEKFEYPKTINIPGYHVPKNPDPALIKKAAIALQKSKKPILIVGHGAILANAQKEIQKLAEKLNIPVAPTLLGLGAISQTHPLNLGMIGMHGHAHTNFAVHNADLILNIGSRFDDRIIGKIEHFGKNATIIHIDVDPAEIGKTIRTDIAIVADALEAAKALQAAVKPATHTSWWKQINTWRQTHPYNNNEDPTKFTIRCAIDEIYNHTLGRHIVTTDVGQHQMWSAQLYKVTDPRKWLSSGGLGDMGYGVPAAMGAFESQKKSQPPVICITGDGSVQMNIQELQTIYHYNMNIKICVMNNSWLGMVRQWQELFYNKNYSETDITTPDLVKLAEAYSIPGYRVHTRKEAQKILELTLAHPGPVLIDFVVENEDNVMPMVPAGKHLGEVIIK
jgi:acetolactate synthase I/II/III large subunit